MIVIIMGQYKRNEDNLVLSLGSVHKLYTISLMKFDISTFLGFWM